MKKALKNKLDKVWRKVGKESAQCEICATIDKAYNYTQLQPHHIIKRSHMATRFDLRNRIWLCARHHTLGNANETAENNLGGWFINWESDNDWMGMHRPEDKEYLRTKRNEIRRWSDEEATELLRNLTSEEASG